MSTQDATADSGELKSRSIVSSSPLNAFSFDGTGSLKDRLLTAAIVLGIAVALTAVALSVPYGRLLVVAWTSAVCVLSAFEVTRLFSRDSVTMAYRPLYGAVHFVALALPSLVACWVAVKASLVGVIDWQAILLAVFVGAQILMVAHVLVGRTRIEDGARYAEGMMPGFLLVGVCAPQLIILSALPLGVHLIWWVAGVVIINDAAAYFAGRSLGRTKMAPALSPNKTVEGSLAGFVLGGGAGLLFGALFLDGLLSISALLMASVLVVFSAQAADLSKSYLKRLRGVKDTGAFFPGHGGVLDRFDGMIGAAPVVVFVLALLGAL